jgi:hypothetical protein
LQDIELAMVSQRVFYGRLKFSPNPRAAQFAKAGVSGFGKRQALATGSSNFMFHPRRSSDHAVRAAEPEWAARRAALHSKLLVLAAIT